jgi:cytochrome P450
VTNGDAPSHVPPDLVVDFDFHNVAGRNEDIHAKWADFVARCREERGSDTHLVFTLHHGGHWLAVTGQAVRDLYADADNLSNASVTIPARPGLNTLPGEADGEEHAASRRALMQWFTPARVRSLAGPVRRIATELIDELEGRGECEFMKEFAFRIPLHLFFELMQLPLSDGKKLLDAVDTVVRGSDAETVTAALEDMFAYIVSVIEMRKAAPGDDVVSHIVTSDFRGEPMRAEMAAGMCAQLLLAGLDTVAATLGFIIRHLAEDADLRAKLVSGEVDIKAATEEFLRRFPTVSLARVVAKDFTYGGVTLRKGERLLLPTAFHGLDPSFFEQPLDVDVNRPNAPMLTFGRGAHQCIGSLLARIELAEALGEWLARIPDFAIASGQQPTLSCGHVAAFAALPLVWPALTG